MAAFTEMSAEHVVMIMLVTTALFTYVNGYCNDLNYLRSRQECQTKFDEQIIRPKNVIGSYSTDRHIVCCSFLRAIRCVEGLARRELCDDDSSHIMLMHIRRKSQGKDCERYDYRYCGAASTVVGSTVLLAATYILVWLFCSS
ncbi:unnamed protein product [Ixodes hexagonus]